MIGKRTMVSGALLGLLIGLGPTPVYADGLGGSCTMSYSGVDARRSCTYFSIPWPTSYLELQVNGYAFANLYCSNLLVARTNGVVGSGHYQYEFINPGGTCFLETGVNGSLYVYAN